MKALRRTRFTRSIVVLLFLVGVLVASMSTPKNVNACGFEFYWDYYAEPEQTTLVGQCWGSCGGPSGCWGSWSEYRSGYSAECPCWP